MLKKLFISLISVFSFLVFAPYVFASTLYLSPGSANIPQGSTVSVSVGLNTAGESINGVSAYLSYPADKIEVAWISYGGSFPIAAEGSYGGGAIRISRGSITGAVGNVNVATIGFRGKSQGTATVSFVGGSAAPRTSDSSESLNLGGSSGGSYKVVAGLPGGQAGSTGLTVPSTTDKDQTPPVISNVKTSLISSTSATISWTTNEEADSTIEYGLNPNKYFLSLYDKSPITTHTIKVEGVALTPGTLFHFRVKSKDAAGNEGISTDYTFQLKGYTVSIKVFDTSGKPIPDTQVFLYTDPLKSKTSSKGEAVFTNVTPGKHLVVIKLNNNFDKTGEIDVKDSPLVQGFILGVDTRGTSLFSYISLAVVGLIILGIILFIILRKRFNTSGANSTP